jgi:hypothetical protein
MKDKDGLLLEQVYRKILVKESSNHVLSKEDYLKISSDVEKNNYANHDITGIGIDNNGRYFAVSEEEERGEDDITYWHSVKYYEKNEHGEITPVTEWRSVGDKEYKHLKSLAQNPVEKEKREKWESEAPERERQKQEAERKAAEHAEWKSNLSAGDREYYGLPQTEDDIRRHGLR